MSKRHSAKYKIDRAMGENLWGRAKSPVNKRSYGPGQHGQRRKSKVSDFGLQLKAKQKLKGYYGNITEKQFAKTYDEAARRKGNTSENLIGLLESRLDAVVYRAKFVPTVWAARQFVSHGHVLVNGKKVDIASYRVKPEDVVTVKEKFAQHGAGAGSSAVVGTRRAGLSGTVGPFVLGPLRSRAGTVGRALRREDGTEPGRRILRLVSRVSTD